MHQQQESHAELVRRIGHAFPLELTIVSVDSGQPISISRKNMISILTVDKHNLVLEAQTAPSMYALMSRFKRSCEAAAHREAAEYRKWKAQKGEDLAKKMPEKKTAAGKPAAKQGPTDAERTTYYQSHEDYRKMAEAPSRLEALAGLFDDLMWAFKMKGEMLSIISRLQGGHSQTDYHARETSNVTPRVDDYATPASTPEAVAAVLALPQSAPPEPPKSL